MASKHLLRRLACRSYSTTNKAIFLTEKQIQSLGVVEQEGYNINSNKIKHVQLTRSLSSELLVQEITVSTDPHVRGSEEADFGRKRIGCVELPKPLIKSISDLIEGIQK
jgi:hypothetical protein